MARFGDTLVAVNGTNCGHAVIRAVFQTFKKLILILVFYSNIFVHMANNPIRSYLSNTGQIRAVKARISRDST